MEALYRLTLHEARARLAVGEISAEELTQAVIDRVVAVDDAIKAYITLTPEWAVEQAREADQARAAGHGAEKPLLGLPIAVKDVLSTAGVPTTCGSKMLADYHPVFDATVVGRLRAAGAVIVGKTNTDEFAMGSSTENSAFFTTRNPWDLGRVPGGSSGGSAAAVAADEALAALGTDTGGSVRQPAALCGVVGLKPTYGRVSRYGLVAFASSLDQVGTLTKDVADAALLLEVLAGHDPLDSTSVDRPVPSYSQLLAGGVRGLRVGVPVEWFGEGIDPGVAATVRAAIEELRRLGAEVREVHLPHNDYAVPVYYIIAPAEASANLARYDGVRYGLRAKNARDIWTLFSQSRELGFGPEVKRRIMLGTYALSAGYYDAYYKQAQQVRTLIKQDFDRAFAEVDIIAGPVSPTPAFRIGERADNPLEMYLADIYTLAVNLAGLPGMSVPCGLTDNLPVGLQLIAPAFEEAALLRVAYAYEQATEWHTRQPPLERAVS